jgi:hypothetical protein
MMLRSKARARWSRLSLLAIALCRIGFGQSAALSLSPGSGSAGSTVALNLSLNASGAQPAAVQWTLKFVPTDISAVTVTATGAATAASKSITCNPATGSLSCVLFGMNSTVVANGILATVAVTISPTTSSTSSVIQLTNNSASTSAGLTIPSTAAGTTIGIIPSAKSFSISGTISPASSGTTVTLGGTASAATTTSATGAYSFTGLANGSYTVTPSRAGMAFTPSNKSVTINGANQTGVNFTSSTAQTFTISGTISPTAGGNGATVTLSGTANATTTANSSGAYSFTGLVNGSYTVTPSHSGYVFTPSSTTLTINGASQTANFTAASTATFTISGTISPTAGGNGATVTLSGATNATTTANSSGAYSFTGLANGSYTVRPSHTGFAFTPSSTTLTINGASQTVNFTAASTATFTVSGTISPTAGGSGATVTLSGAANATTTANASGAYSFTGLANGSYTVTPTHSGYVFTPSSTTFSINGSNQTINFTAASTATFTISGTISPTAGGSGATVTLTGATNATTTANSSGAYSFAGLANGSYTVTPSHAGYTFTPSSTTLTINGANQIVNFTANSTATFTISGAISVTAGGSGATVTLTGKANAVATASAAGAYTFTGLLNGTYTVTPSKPGRAFAPSSQTVTINGANIVAINFAAGTATSNVSKNANRGTAEPDAALRHERNGLDRTADSGIAVTGMTCTPSSVTPPAKSTCQVTLSAGAPATGATLSLSGAANAIAPASLVIAPGASVSSFTTDTTAVTAPTTALMTASLGESSASSPLTLLAAPPSSALSLDVTTSQDSMSVGSAVTSPAFSTASGDELLVAMVSANSATPTSVSKVEGGGLNWVRTAKTNAQGGTSEVWRAFAPSTLSNVSVTATLSNSAYSSLTVMSFEGADPGEDGSGAIGAVTSASAAATLVTTRDGSWVLGVGNAGSVSTRVAGPDQHVVHQFQSPNGGTSWVQREINATAAADTTVSLNAVSSDRYNLSAVEILPRSACMAGLTPQRRSFAMGGGSSTVTVANGFGCSWRAATDSPSWITLNNNSGTGNSSFTFTAAPNMGKTRMGTVRVANQSFKVVQEGSTQVFADVPESAPFFDDANLMYSSGISTGCVSSPLQYCPAQPLTRREMAALLVSALDHLDRSSGALPQGYTTTPYFQDVPATDPSFPFVQRLADLGLTGGCSGARYCPSSTITHGELAKVMVLGWMRSSNLTSFTSSPAPYFTDVATTDSFFPYVQKMRDMGFWTGCSATEYCTSRPVLESDMSALVMRSLVGAP